ncbi:oxidoreductase (L-gululonolactone oxidase) (plasmid) [Legionella adelaidensis]|uniref:L-gululonolactone oxidase n=1 Tax=Legionella adelaidensis TaxID=45056 RepID=A0A0W0R3H8_9GAMM|nr:FAD-binding oxidoreductase [Legionella adelaidensis]KTC65613.1 L-gululonolactone oxidase [Legionella adelaidensis]VEH85190.1 oxidoreductase (L-gululonolactone oxidase) [Legionella adelaidensis]
MRAFLKTLSNFSRAITTRSYCYRPENEKQVKEVFLTSPTKNFLPRGNGLSYSDCCLLNKGNIIETTRLRHLISFDKKTGVAICQAGVTFADLFLLDKDFIPPVLPGTLFATLAGGVANDVHGKNNHNFGTIGQHILWLELQVDKESVYCSPTDNSSLFYATIGGLGLTGFIKRLSIQLQKASHIVERQSIKFTNFENLLHFMQTEGLRSTYQAAWLQLNNTENALLITGTTVHDSDYTPIMKKSFRIPNLPFKVISALAIKYFNWLYFHLSSTTKQRMPLWEFNNPLDKIQNWNHLYGKKGLLQFQAVFGQKDALLHIHTVLKIIQENKATPTLSVLKYFTNGGAGLLSFVEPGFTLAIDFIHNDYARKTISALNQYICEIGGKVYLAKDLFLTEQQYNSMYKNHLSFSQILHQYNSPMCSDLSKRLGITLIKAEKQ